MIEIKVWQLLLVIVCGALIGLLMACYFHKKRARRESFNMGYNCAKANILFFGYDSKIDSMDEAYQRLAFPNMEEIRNGVLAAFKEES